MNPTDAEMEQFVKDRREALLSFNEQTVRGYFLKYEGTPGPIDARVLWTAVHKAITACTDLPMEARSKSKKWLVNRGYSPADDGDVPMPTNLEIPPDKAT